MLRSLSKCHRRAKDGLSWHQLGQHPMVQTLSAASLFAKGLVADEQIWPDAYVVADAASTEMTPRLGLLLSAYESVLASAVGQGVRPPSTSAAAVAALTWCLEQWRQPSQRVHAAGATASGTGQRAARLDSAPQANSGPTSAAAATQADAPQRGKKRPRQYAQLDTANWTIQTRPGPLTYARYCRRVLLGEQHLGASDNYEG